jgi:hypothetical protein
MACGCVLQDSKKQNKDTLPSVKRSYQGMKIPCSFCKFRSHHSKCYWFCLFCLETNKGKLLFPRLSFRMDSALLTFMWSRSCKPSLCFLRFGYWAFWSAQMISDFTGSTELKSHVVSVLSSYRIVLIHQLEKSTQLLFREVLWRQAYLVLISQSLKCSMVNQSGMWHTCDRLAAFPSWHDGYNVGMSDCTLVQHLVN